MRPHRHTPEQAVRKLGEGEFSSFLVVSLFCGFVVVQAASGPWRTKRAGHGVVSRVSTTVGTV